MEELKIIKQYIFSEAHVNSILHIGGRRVEQNRYVYEEVIKVIPADRIKVIGRHSSNNFQKKGFPELPMTYRFLKIHSAKPSYYPVHVSASNKELLFW